MQPSAFGVSRLGRTVTGGMFWILIYSIGYFRMDWHWIIVTLGAWYCMNLFWKMPKKDSKTAKKHSKVLSTDLPAWVVSMSDSPSTINAYSFTYLLCVRKNFCLISTGASRYATGRMGECRTSATTALSGNPLA